MTDAEALGWLADMAGAMAEDQLAQVGIRLSNDELGEVAKLIYRIISTHTLPAETMALVRQCVGEGKP